MRKKKNNIDPASGFQFPEREPKLYEVQAREGIDSNAAALMLYICEHVLWARKNGYPFSSFDISYWMGVAEQIRQMGAQATIKANPQMMVVAAGHMHDLIFATKDNSFNEEDKTTGHMTDIFMELANISDLHGYDSFGVGGDDSPPEGDQVIDFLENMRGKVIGDTPPVQEEPRKAPSPDEILRKQTGRLTAVLFTTTIETISQSLAMAQMSRCVLLSINESDREKDEPKQIIEKMTTTNQLAISRATAAFTEGLKILKEARNLEIIDDESQAQIDMFEENAQRCIELYDLEATSHELYARVWNKLTAEARKDVIDRQNLAFWNKHKLICDDNECGYSLFEGNFVEISHRLLDENGNGSIANNTAAGSAISIIDNVYLDLTNGDLVLSSISTFPQMDKALTHIIDRSLLDRKDSSDFLVGFLKSWTKSVPEHKANRVMMHLAKMTAEERRLEKFDVDVARVKKDLMQTKRDEEGESFDEGDHEFAAIMLVGNTGVMSCGLEPLKRAMDEAKLEMGMVDGVFESLSPEDFLQK